MWHKSSKYDNRPLMWICTNKVILNMLDCCSPTSMYRKVVHHDLLGIDWFINLISKQSASAAQSDTIQHVTVHIKQGQYTLKPIQK